MTQPARTLPISDPLIVVEALSSNDPLSVNPDEVMAAFDESGLVLLRGFDFNPLNFETFSRLFCDRFHIVAARHGMRVEGDGHSTSVPEKNYFMLGHSEGTYKPYPVVPPHACFFMCITPPVAPGGETIVIDGTAFIERMPGWMRKRFEDEGIMYEMLLPPERWRYEFHVDSVEALEARIATLSGVKHRFEGDQLHVLYTAPAFTPTRQGGMAFATGMMAHLPHLNHPRYIGKAVHTKPSNHVYFGGGEELSDENVNTLLDIHDALAYGHRWRAQEVMMVDNTRFMHGRVPMEYDCERTLMSRFGWLKSFL